MSYTETSSRPTTEVELAGKTSVSTVDSSTAAPSTRAILATAVAGATSFLQACGGGGEDSPTPSSFGVSSTPEMSAQAAIPASGAAAVAGASVGGGKAGPLGAARKNVIPASDSDAARFLLQAQFSASDKEIASVRSLGYAGWLATQFDAPAGITAWDWLNQHGYATLDSNLFHFTPYQTDFALWYQLVKSPDGVRKRVALALSEIFCVSTNGVDWYWLSHMMASWWDTLSAGAFGNFRTLLENITLHPAMGKYLNCRGSQKESASGRQPDENFARELMQLMTIGLVKFGWDGQPLTSGGVPVESYTQDDVVNLARVFTGYDFNLSSAAPTSFNGLSVPDKNFARLPMVVNPALHSTLEVKFLGTTIPAGTSAEAARKIALDTLFNHPNVGPFISRQLIQRLVTSNPSRAYVFRVASVFANNGSGVRGDIAATVAAILLDDEARSPASLSTYGFGHLREPMVRLVQWARTFGLESARGSWKLPDQSLSTQLGQSPLRSPTVFNFFRPNYTPPNTAIAAGGQLAPEFQIVNESTVSSYLNYMMGVVRNGFYVGAPDKPQITSNASNAFDMVASYANELPLAPDAGALVARLNLLLAANQLSAPTVALIVNALNANPVTATSPDVVKLNRVASAVLMVMASSEYLVQK
ncbi:DUF1800 domain-containing protein [Xylophilus sp. GOD-11R]|uniref:DUF1800 domain-containing protein n=1 Tax=Xylophilus sp. GOD-11R TaxID=3089814 RepID=UPI00298CB8D5|nr:DUF1800 domain-containing protein [Xylophilus sp. GOD-11R]WPB55974.1 DUF1800 domain-containing protein [Xylophilus sp. GOD-11R]